MKDKIQQLWIKNFKSIRNLKLDCKKINLFVGAPNVGKSNILEAISLYGNSPSAPSKFMSDSIRYESIDNLFYDQVIDVPIHIISPNLGVLELKYSFEKGKFRFAMLNSQELVDLVNHYPELDFFDIEVESVNSTNGNGESDQQKKSACWIDADGRQSNWMNLDSPVKKYVFKKFKASQNGRDSKGNESSYFLSPPFGENLFRVIQSSKALREEVAELFGMYNLRFQLDMKNNSFQIIKFLDELMYSIPYSSVADTLQRIIFYYAAILSNRNSILLFEEPESRSFPPYIRSLGYKIIEDEFDNQFFIATHSPQLFNTLIENTPDKDLAVFVTYYENFETKVRLLNSEDLSELLNHGINIFSNINRYANEYSPANIG